MTPVLIELTIEEFTQATDLSRDSLMQMVEEGILVPGQKSGQWRFQAQLVARARRASRLHRDLGIDWSGIALALELLDELEQTRRENRRLRQRLGRFLED
ncbi:hypothetical protein GCM10011348_26500 [Marinobacterium nitratireducens]|uniref:Chaperone modulatory protein CbpM n=1 Tax=Marinobacterium nitratireducens TaxID=518897 RepID=A0A918DTZ1_9GAMM|nr:chaperone modulator CbpM [Marinobacterium nitratireducens]GGO83231.1 hypothetical protein GCM10011348_26500 [Marinobacterium nitratireducens]